MNDDHSFKSLSFQEGAGKQEMLNPGQPGTIDLRDGPAAGHRHRTRQAGCVGVGLGAVPFHTGMLLTGKGGVTKSYSGTASVDVGVLVN